MLPYSTEDAVSVLSKSQNLNAALKNYLKREVPNGDPAARFVKDFRAAIDSSNTARLQSYIEKARPQYDLPLIGICGYAHMETVGQIVTVIANKFADEFNSTYDSSGGTLKFKNQKRFDEIMKEALRMLDSELEKRDFRNSTFMKNAVLATIFEKAVLDYALANHLK